jgi:hypothetical protein
MKRLSILFVLLSISIAIKAQLNGFDPFYDAVPYSVKEFNTSFLTNQSAETVKSFFENQKTSKPIRVLKIDQGYHHGYRIYYQYTTNPEGPEQWIQIFTTDVSECLERLEKTNNELLEAPFLGLKFASKKYDFSDTEVAEVIHQYKHLACMYYQQTFNSRDQIVNEMYLVFQKYNSKLSDETGQMLVSMEDGLIIRPVSSRDYSWNLWMQCLEEVNQIGYKTLIEYSEPPSFAQTR